MSYDPIGQWERTQVDEPMPSAHQHQVLGIGCSLLGIPLAHTMVWDAMRSLDYLQSRPEVDPQRLGATGYSGGGNLTALIMALDDRVTCAVPAVFLSSLPRLVFHYGAQDAEATFFGQIPAGFGHSDYAALRAPKPTLLCAATRDSSGIEGTRETFAEARAFFRAIGAEERVAMVETDGGHGYHPPLRKAMAGWMARWLKDRTATITEAPVKSFASDELKCTKLGNVAALPGAKTLFALNAEQAERWNAQRSRLWREDPGTAVERVRRLAGVRPSAAIAVRRASEVKGPGGAGGNFTETELVAGNAPPIPVRLFLPAGQPAGLSLVVFGANDGDRERAQISVDREIARGRKVLLAEVMGTGRRLDRETKHRNFLEALGPNFEAASLAFKLGTPFLGLRTEEIQACASHLQNGASASVDLVAVGEIVPAALHAVALEPARFGSFKRSGGLESWKSLFTARGATGQYASVVPGALRHYDLPDLATYARARGVKVERADLP
ncbi:MAG: alpha/beta hydrolase family protein [Candidatus Acidiferrales bacterium]